MVLEYPAQFETMSPTPYTDILTHSPYLKDISKKSREEADVVEKNYSKAIDEMKRRRKSSSGG
jgi:hypothetical protein